MAALTCSASTPARNTYVRAPASAYLTGFSIVEGRQAYEATAPGDPRNGGVMCGQEGSDPCAVRLSEPFAFKPFSSRSLVFVP